ncbi:MAG: cob(I)yrinic acid a,c-diamide adenosyltransferase [Gammaproteobacteria bacterium]|nr:MAG: cob(I)yrinic acid a,c-diamide adenosyltransferase [Gammaproteobacteria bacterium]
MGHRLSKIYTRTGDDGSTGLSQNRRLPKDHWRIEAIGAIDELNAAIGVVLTETIADKICSALTGVQHRLFDLGGELSIEDRQLITEDHVDTLEETLDSFNEELEPLKEFILPGGVASAAYCHLARTICRRAERRLCRLAREETVSPVLIKYINRLSDLLFVLARCLNKQAGKNDVLWLPEENK